MDEKCFFVYIFREKREISKNRAATNSVEGRAPKKATVQNEYRKFALEYR